MIIGNFVLEKEDKIYQNDTLGCIGQIKPEAVKCIFVLYFKPDTFAISPEKLECCEMNKWLKSCLFILLMNGCQLIECEKISMIQEVRTHSKI